MSDPFNLKNKTIVITGASSGIGRQCALTCSELGAKVVLLGRDTRRLEETVHSISKNLGQRYYALDLTEFDKIDSVAEDILNSYGKIDGIIHSAGISTTLPLKMIKPEKLKEFFDVNVTAAINLTRIFTKKKYFSDNGGSIIFMSSVMGIVGEVGKTIYSLSKGALVSGVKSMALELAPKKIRVNAILPGVVETPMSKNAVYSRSDEAFNKIKNLHPLGLGKPEDIANACIFLLSDAARWVTGTNLVVDGGYTAR